MIGAFRRGFVMVNIAGGPSDQRAMWDSRRAQVSVPLSGTFMIQTDS
jgi:hypothetical protein